MKLKVTLLIDSVCRTVKTLKDVLWDVDPQHVHLMEDGKLKHHLGRLGSSVTRTMPLCFGHA